MVPCDSREATHVELKFPTGDYKLLAVVPQEDGPHWEWNRSTSAPTLSPSIRNHYPEQPATSWHPVVPAFCCHSFVENGNVRFLDDCTHELAGKTVALLDLDT